MKIAAIRAVDITLPSLSDLDLSSQAPYKTAKRPAWTDSGPVANPMTRYPRYGAFRPSWMPTWRSFGCVVEAEDGTTGFARAAYGRPVAAIIDDYLGPRLAGEDCLATENCYDMMVRLGAPYGASGLHAYAVSAIDLAMWDLKGKLLKKPVYELLGGPARDDLFCYATGGDVDWYLELGFSAIKLPCPYGPADGLEGERRNTDMVAQARELAGDGTELMLDCWMAFDVEYGVRLAEALRPYKLKWMEEMLPSEDFDAHAQLRQRIPWQTLATGEHWYTTVPFQHAAGRHLVDIFQPDINWVGGMTALVKICAIAEAAGITVIPHCGGNSAYGQHACLAMPAIPWAECFIDTAPGVAPPVSMYGVAAPEKGRMRPTDAPGFGVEVAAKDMSPFDHTKA
jgi:L-rhamnonate dehydratase